MRLIRPLRPHVLFLTVASLLAVACGASSQNAATSPAVTSAPRSGTSAESSVAPPPRALLAVGRAGESGLEVIETDRSDPALRMPLGVPDTDWVHILTTVPDGTGTIVRNRQFGDDTGPEVRLDGQWRLPTIGGDALPVGRSLNGSTAVLVEDRGPGYGATIATRFALLRIDGDGSPRLLRTLQLKGAFEFDALSPTGSVLYLVEHLDPGNGGRYQVRSMDIAASALDATPITDKRLIDEPMAGVPITQLRRADGLVMTLYRGAEHPFVHVLNSVDRWAVCLDLPANGADDPAAALDWGLAETSDARTVYAVNATLGLVVEISPADLTVRRTARLSASTAAGPAIVLAKFGHADSEPVGRRAAVAPDGATIVAGGARGVVGIAAKDLSVAWRALDGQAVGGLALTRDGTSVFALLVTGRIVALSTSDGSSRGAVPGVGYDRLVAITGG